MRVLFTVALAVAVAGVVLPAVETAGRDRAESETRDAVETLVQAARSLSDGNDALRDPDAAARQVLVLDLPDDGFASARLASLSVGPPPSTTPETGSGDAATTRAVWRVGGGQRHTMAVDGIRLRASDGSRFRLDGGGRHRLVLRLVDHDGDRVVTVSRDGTG